MYKRQRSRSEAEQAHRKNQTIQQSHLELSLSLLSSCVRFFVLSTSLSLSGRAHDNSHCLLSRPFDKCIHTGTARSLQAFDPSASPYQPDNTKTPCPYPQGGTLRRAQYGASAWSTGLDYGASYGCSADDPSLIVTRATEAAKFGEGASGWSGYSLLTNNCETFAYWCSTGRRVCGAVSSENRGCCRQMG